MLANIDAENIKKSTDLHVANKTLQEFYYMACVFSQYTL